MNHLSKLLKSLISEFEKINLCYCVIGNYDNLPEYTENDVDFWVNDVRKAEKILLKSANIVGLSLYMQNKTANGSNNYFYNSSSKEVEIVKIDLMSETAFKSIITIVPEKLIQENRIQYKYFYVANNKIEGAMHLLYPLVTFGRVKEKYKNKLFKLSQLDEFRDILIQLLGKKLSSEIFNAILEKDWIGIEKKAPIVRRYLIYMTLRKMNFKRCNILFNYLGSVFIRIIKKNGIVIGFTGIDGAGKTSIKNYLIENADNYFTKNRTIEFYWRPFLLPTVSKLMGSPIQKEEYDSSGKRVLKNNIFNLVRNYIKYCYYLLDFILGQIKYFKESHTGGLIIFDRYHFDNIIYPERFGFNINKRIMRFFDSYIIPQPDLLFYLTANTKILYDRKHEIDINTIETQKMLYELEIDLRKSIITVDSGGAEEVTFNKILLKCLEHMSNRYI